MNKLERARALPLSEEKIQEHIAFALSHGYSEEAIQILLDEQQDSEMWMNDVYTVTVRRDEDVTHVSIRRNDRGVAKDWRDFQEIKNQIVGPECEAIELYPAESRVVDSANQWHLWAINDSTQRVPVGFFGARLVTDESIGGSVQRPRGVAV